MLGIPVLSWVILGAAVVVGASMVPLSFWSSLIVAPKGAANPDKPASQDSPAQQVDLGPQNYLAVQKMLLEARAACTGCPEAVNAIDAAIKATVAIVVRPGAGA